MRLFLSSASPARPRLSRSLVFLFHRTVFFSIALGLCCICAVFLLLLRLGYLRLADSSPNFLLFLGFIALLSILVSVVAARIVGEKLFAPVRELQEASKKVADGDFSVSVRENSEIRELQEMAHSFNCMVHELQSTEIVHSDFIRNISHELRTPLSSIEGYATLMQSPSLSEDKRLEYAGKIIAGTRRLSALTDSILTLSRLENRQVGIQRAPFALDEQLRQTVLLYEKEWTAKDIGLELRLPPVTCSGSEELLYQVWQNLIGNAVKFCGQGGRIAVSCGQDEKQVRVVVRDNGIGIPAQDLGHIFEKFYQSERSRSTPGNGLGLTLAKQIAELHGGRIEALSNPAEGTVFTVTLPKM